MRHVAAGRVPLFPRHELLDLVVIEGKARGIIVRNMDTGVVERHGAHAVVVATGGFGKIYYLSTLAMGCNASAIWRAHKRGAFFADPRIATSSGVRMIFRNRRETIIWNVVIRPLAIWV